MSAIHIGVGGWDYDPWRETFYPPGLPKKKQLEHLARHVTAIEINTTFYRLQKPDWFAACAKAVPDGFKFSIKASRISTNRKNLGEGAATIGRFLAQGFTELGDRLGPILWQLAPTKAFDPKEIRAFLMLLPTSRDGIRLRHALEVRHASFACREFVAMARAAGVAITFADHETYPEIADITADFVYARLQRTAAKLETGYTAKALDRWADAARVWSAGESPEGLNYISKAKPPATPREVFAFVISGAKERNPAAANALIDRLSLIERTI